MHQIKESEYLHHTAKMNELKPIGIFETRAPIDPNPIGLMLVELIKREANVLSVRGLDAYDDTPVLDIKANPNWEHGMCIVINDFRIPKWLNKLK